MKILFNDLVQSASCAIQIKTPSLADITTLTTIPITWTASKKINCIGIGNTDATTVSINDGVTTQNITFTENGLYLLNEINASSVTVTHNGSKIGRIALGVYSDLGTARPKEPGFASTEESRMTLGGQIIEGAGGYGYRTVSVDTRYKIDATIMAEIQAAYNGQIAKNYPFFIYFDSEINRLPFLRMYAIDKNQMSLSFESSINKKLYSRKFNLRECF